MPVSRPFTRIEESIHQRSAGQWALKTLSPIASGYIADVFRAEIEAQNRSPQTVVIKLRRETGGINAQFCSYEREWFFYRHLRSRIKPMTPEIYLQGESPAADEGLLLLEDMRALVASTEAPSSRPTMADQLVHAGSGSAFGMSIYAGEQPGGHQAGSSDWIKSGIEVTAALHSSDISAEEIPYHFSDNIAQLGPLSDQECAAMEVLGASEQRHRFIALVEAQSKGIVSDEPEPFGIIHCDLRPDNLIAAAEWVILDWGDYCFGPVAFDLAYFFATSRTPPGMINSLLQRYATERQNVQSTETLSPEYLLARCKHYWPLVARTPLLFMADSGAPDAQGYWESVLSHTFDLWNAL